MGGREFSNYGRDRSERLFRFENERAEPSSVLLSSLSCLVSKEISLFCSRQTEATASRATGRLCYATSLLLDDFCRPFRCKTLSVRLSVYLSVARSVCLSGCLSLSSIFMSGGNWTQAVGARTTSSELIDSSLGARILSALATAL